MATLEQLQEQKKKIQAEIKRRGGAKKAPGFAARLENVEREIRNLQINVPPTPDYPVTGSPDNRGESTLGLCHPKYDVDGLIARAKKLKVFRFGWLDKFFNGRDSNNAVKVLKQPFQKWLRLHVINGPGLNNNRVQKHEITYGYTNASLQKAILAREPQFMKKFSDRLAHLRWVVDQAKPGTLEVLAISPWLEHTPNVSQRVMDILADEVRKFFPEAFIVDNPVSGPFLKGYWKEKHGNEAPADCDIVDLDGISMESVDLRKYGERHPRAKAVLAWDETENGNHHKDKVWKPPQARTNFPTGREFDLCAYFMRPDALVETSALNPQDKTGLKILPVEDGGKKGFLFKEGDGRRYAVVLLPTSFNSNKPERVVIKKNGRIVDTGRVRGKYTEDKSNRWIVDFTKSVTVLPCNIVIAVDGKYGFVIPIPGLNRVD